MAVNRFLESLKSNQSGAVPDLPPQVDEDSEESPHGDGRDSRHQVLAVQLVQPSRNARAVLYGSIVGTIDYDPSRGISWAFEGKDGLEKVTVTGRLLDRIYDRLCVGKREVIRVSDQSVTGITFAQVAEEK